MRFFSSLRSSKAAAGLIAIIIIVIIFAVGFYAGYREAPAAAKVLGVSGMAAGEPESVDFSTFWQVWNLINQKYVPTGVAATTTTNNQDKVYGAIQGMVASLGDPYTIFFPPQQNQNFSDEISGTLDGVGMEVGMQNGVLTVIAPVKGSPAEAAGVKSGDSILDINGTDTTGLSVDDAVNEIRGPAGTIIKLTLQHLGAKTPYNVSIVRQVINVPTINTEEKNGVFIIQLYEFTATSPNLFTNALRQFVESGDQYLVLDLRGNPGGYLDAAVEMASYFLPPQDTVVTEKYGDGTEDVYKSQGYDIFNKNLKMAVLIDGGSASASEILAGALSDNGVATLVGQKSFGKGSVQELIPITSDTSLKVTIARWLTPAGISISEQGITPKVLVPITAAEIAAGDDTQLEATIEVVKGEAITVPEGTSTPNSQ